MRIAVTQRVEHIVAYDERRDSLDQEWTNLLTKIDCDCVPIPNCLTDVNSWLERQRVDALLLTGGNDLSHLLNANNIAPERDSTEIALLQWANEHQAPVFAVCRGMQMLNYFLGGTTSRVLGHVSSVHKVVSITDNILFREFSAVNSFHGWGIKSQDLSNELEALVLAEDGVIEAVRHRSLPWVGIMWHPERNNGVASSNDLALIKKIFFEFNKV